VEVRYSKAGEGGEEEEAVCKAVIETSGRVSLAHPRLVDHAVICPSVPAARLWLENYYEKAAENADEEMIDDLPDSEDEEAAPAEVQPLPPVLRLLRTPSLPSGRSTDRISLFLQTKEQKDEAALFYELGHTAFTSFFQKTISRAQILVKAREEVLGLEREGSELEGTKAELLRRRKKLLDSFTASLGGLPVGRKKAAVVELKEQLRRAKEPEPSGGQPAAVQPPAVSAGSPTPYSDLTGINTVRPDGTVLRPMNAFMLWAKERRGEMVRQGMPVAEVSQVCGTKCTNPILTNQCRRCRSSGSS
jgi:hypothetical protein